MYNPIHMPNIRKSRDKVLFAQRFPLLKVTLHYNFVKVIYFLLMIFSLFSYGLKGPVYLKDKTGQVVTSHITEESVYFGPGQ